ncbi:MAG: Flagellar motor switch protein FliN [Firmicutes bacterium]|nr:Flagellar motor switch protein FliN [Bacillota bacterium]
MSNRYLSQDEIDAILHMGVANELSTLSAMEADAIGEVGNISMGTAATTLSQLLGQRVSITTPRVTVTTLAGLYAQFSVPYLAISVNYTKGLAGYNLLVVRNDDAAVIADLMMGGDGRPASLELDEMRISAVSEVMNQMIGTAATSMHSLFGRQVNISPPSVVQFDHPPKPDANLDLSEETLVVVTFRMVIGSFVDSELLQIMPMRSAQQMVELLMPPSPSSARHDVPPPVDLPSPIISAPEVPVVQRAQFSQLPPPPSSIPGANIDLILDVPLHVSVVLGKCRRSIKDVITMGIGSVVELDRMVEDQVDILVNGTLIAKGEIVVVNENFGVRLTSILSPVERLKELAKGK